MEDFDKICDIYNLYKAHAAARRGKQGKRDIIIFEMKLSQNLFEIKNSLLDGSYKPGDYRQFYVYDPKVRLIHAPLYKDVVVQRCICDQFLAPFLENRLIYDNAACRKDKGTHFAINRLSQFLRNYYKQHGAAGYILKCDFQKYFNNIDHDILKYKLKKIIIDRNILKLLYIIIDSYENESGKGLPLGNQTSQWFALLYLDTFDRFIKEQLQIKYYSRYMDDCVLIHDNKEYLKECLEKLIEFAFDNTGLCFNNKTHIFPTANGVKYLGFHFYITETGKVIRKVRSTTKTRFKRCLSRMKKDYAEGLIKSTDVRQRICSYVGHLKHGHTYRLQKKIMKEYVLIKNSDIQ